MRNLMKGDPTMKKRAKKLSGSFDWSRADAMTEEQRHAAALADPDAQPLTEAEAQEMKPIPAVKRLRIRLRLTQEEFGKSTAFRSPPCATGAGPQRTR